MSGGLLGGRWLDVALSLVVVPLEIINFPTSVVHWLLFTGCCLLAVVYWLLFIGCCLLAVVYWLLFIGCCLPTATVY